MHSPKTFASLLLCSLALAASHVPVTVVNLDSDFDVNCGKTTVAGKDIYNAVAWATSLNENGQTVTGDNGKPYPHYFGNSNGFKWISSECNNPSGGGNNNERELMPVIKGGFFGEDSNTAEGKFRAVYYYNNDQDTEGHPKAFYCGTIYHPKSDNSFAGCDVTT